MKVIREFVDCVHGVCEWMEARPQWKKRILLHI